MILYASANIDRVVATCDFHIVKAADECVGGAFVVHVKPSGEPTRTIRTIEVDVCHATKLLRMRPNLGQSQGTVLGNRREIDLHFGICFQQRRLMRDIVVKVALASVRTETIAIVEITACFTVVEWWCLGL